MYFDPGHFRFIWFIGELWELGGPVFLVGALVVISSISWWKGVRWQGNHDPSFWLSCRIKALVLRMKSKPLGYEWAHLHTANQTPSSLVSFESCPEFSLPHEQKSQKREIQKGLLRNYYIVSLSTSKKDLDEENLISEVSRREVFPIPQW